MEVFGILSAILFNTSGLLAAYRIVRQGHADNMMSSFLYPWLGGSLTGLIYAFSLSDMPLILNFGFGVLFGTIILRYKLWPTYRRPPGSDRSSRT